MGRWQLQCLTPAEAAERNLIIEQPCSPPFVPQGPLPPDWERIVSVFDAAVERRSFLDIASAHATTVSAVERAVGVVLMRYNARHPAQAFVRLIDEGYGPPLAERRIQAEPSWPWILGLMAEGAADHEIQNRLGLGAVRLSEHLMAMKGTFGCAPAKPAFLRGGYQLGLLTQNTANRGMDENVGGVQPMVLSAPAQPDDLVLPDEKLVVLKGRSYGLTRAGIGKKLSVTEGTVKTHITTALDSLDATDAAEAVAKAVVLGHISCGRPVRLVWPMSLRELEVVSRVAQGMSNREIGDMLWITENTVKTHLKRIFAKLAASSRVAVVRHAFAAGLLLVGRPAPAEAPISEGG